MDFFPKWKFLSVLHCKMYDQVSNDVKQFLSPLEAVWPSG